MTKHGKGSETLTTAPVLTFFDPTKRIMVSTNASKNGIGAVLLQAAGEHWKPVAYASKSMTETECRYAQIEKECLWLVFGLQGPNTNPQLRIWPTILHGRD